MAGEMNLKEPVITGRSRSSSISAPSSEPRRASFLYPGGGQRRGSRALDVKGSKSQTPLAKWIAENVDKQMIGLGINFLILVVLLMLLKVVVQWIQITQQAARTMAAGQRGGGAGENS